MTASDLPAPIAAFVDIVNRGDSDAFLALFAPDGLVEDWGRRFAGRNAIAGWNDKEMIGAKGTLSVTKVISEAPDEIAVMTHWKSNFFTGDGKFTFRYAGGKIREMVISEA